MCTFPSEVKGETRQERRVRLACDVANGRAKIEAHTERLRNENPRLFAALQPLLADLHDWTGSVSAAVSNMTRDVGRLEFLGEQR